MSLDRKLKSQNQMVLNQPNFKLTRSTMKTTFKDLKKKKTEIFIPIYLQFEMCTRLLEK